ncbi:energy transducer TonB, partial [Pseudomonas aeruginosa]
ITLGCMARVRAMAARCCWPPESCAGYPALAMRRGWEGTVLLRVHVLASGSPSEIQVQKSSGREALDQAAVKAVKRWSFVPAKRGDKAEDGWVSVPIDFKLN